MFNNFGGEEYRCVVCNDEIARGEWAFCVEEGYVHDDENCLLSYLLENYGFREVAALAGIRAEPAGDSGWEGDW